MGRVAKRSNFFMHKFKREIFAWWLKGPFCVNKKNLVVDHRNCSAQARNPASWSENFLAAFAESGLIEVASQRSCVSVCENKLSGKLRVVCRIFFFCNFIFRQLPHRPTYFLFQSVVYVATVVAFWLNFLFSSCQVRKARQSSARTHAHYKGL